MDNEKRGKFLKELRKSKNMTQFQLGELLNYSDKNISKWENGISFPTDPEILKRLSIIFDISFEELLYGQYKDENPKEIEEEFFNLYTNNYNNKKKMKRMMITIIIASLISIVLMFMLVYFIYIKGKIISYKITGESVKDYLIEGSLLVTNDKSILNLNYIKTKEEIDEITLYLIENNVEIGGFSGGNDNYYIEEYNGSTEYNLNKMPNNDTYIKIKYKNKTEEIIKLDIRERYSNKNLIPEPKMEPATGEKKVSKNDKLLKYGFVEKDGHVEKRINEYTIIYFSIDSFLVQIIKDHKYIMIDKSLNTKNAIYSELYNGKTKTKSIDIEEKSKCEDNKCETVEELVKYLNYLCDEIENN